LLSGEPLRKEEKRKEGGRKNSFVFFVTKTTITIKNLRSEKIL